MSPSSLHALAALCLVVPPAGMLGCSKSEPPPVALDGVIRSGDHGKGDLVGSLWNCKSSCTCSDGRTTPVACASCAATDVEAKADAGTACARACAVRGDPSVSAAFVEEQCAPANEVCGYVQPYIDFGGEVDLASSPYDGGIDDVDLSTTPDQL